ncbi:MAG: O-antigen ligase family protein [Planctomycetota bacterium]
MAEFLEKFKTENKSNLGLMALFGIILGILILTLGLKSIVVIIILGAGIVILFRPDIGLLLVLGLFPLETMGRFAATTDIVQVSIVQICGILSVLSWLIHTIIKKSKVFFTSHYIVFIGMALLAIVTVFFAVDKKEGMTYLIHLFANFGLYFLVVNIIDSERLLKSALVVILLVSLLISGFSIYQRFDPSLHGGEIELGFKGKGGGMLIEEKELGILIRTSGFMRHYDALAFFLMLPIGIAFYMNRLARSAITKNLLLASTIIYFAALVLTFSKVGIIGLVVLISLLLIKKVLKITPAVTFYFIVIALLGILFVPKTYWLRVLPIKQYTARSEMVSMRVTVWENGLRMFMDNWLFGVGLGNFNTNLDEYEPDLMPVRGGYSAHNTYLEIACEWGILGVMLFSAFIWITFKDLRSSREILKTTDNYQLSFLSHTMGAIYIAFLIFSFAHSMEWRKEWWLVPALSVVIRKLSLLSLNKRTESYE